MTPLHILVAGPYRSGTGDDPAKIQANVDAMTDMALRLFRAGHLPVLGEWYALPLIEHRRLGSRSAMRSSTRSSTRSRAASSTSATRCLRIGGPSAGADDMVATARAFGKHVFHRFEDIPGCA